MPNANQTPAAVLRPIVNYAFGAFAVLLLGIMCWLIQTNQQQFERLIEIQGENNKIQVENHKVIQGNTEVLKELGRIVHDKL